MTKTLSAGPIKASIAFTHAETTSLGTSLSNSDSVSYSKTFTDGTGSGKANLLFAAKYTIAGAGTRSIDLNAAAGTPITDLFGDNITFSKVKVIWVQLTSDTTATTISVGGDTNALVNWVGDKTDKVVIRNDGVLLLACYDGTGYAVTAGTGDILLITNNDATNSATVKVVLIGE